MRRIAFYLFFDEQGVVDDYVLYKLEKLHEHAQTIFVVSNSRLDDEARARLESVADTVHERKNVGFDVWAYKEAMEVFGREALDAYDELILLNYTFFGPIFPFAEMFGQMESRDADFWGISAHRAVTPNPWTGQGTLPLHIQSHFIAVHRRMFQSQAFRDYWDTMPMITSYDDSILRHESRFTEHFHAAGFRSAVYLDPELYPTDYAVFTSLEMAIENRCPILKRRIFVHDPIYLEQNAVFPRRSLEYIATHTDYDVDLIWRSIVRSAEPRTLYTNLDMLEILSDDADDAPPVQRVEPRIAVVVHMYYHDMMDEVVGYARAIPEPFDLYVTTDTQAKADELRAVLDAHGMADAQVRLTGGNQGRDMAPLFVDCRDVLLSDRYEFICRLHSKKSPQDGYFVGRNFKEHMFGNLLYNRHYVGNLLAMFDRERTLGMAIAPVVHIGYGTLGHAWSVNRELTRTWAKKLGIRTIFDADTPLAAFGGMFWARTAALRKLSAHPWKITDFDEEVGKVDGTLPHVLERLAGYAVLDAGYHIRGVMNRRSAAVGYTKLEYKLQRVGALMPGGSVRGQIDWLHMLRAHLAVEQANAQSLRFHLRVIARIVRDRLIGRFPGLAGALRPLYRRLRGRPAFRHDVSQ